VCPSSVSHTIEELLLPPRSRPEIRLLPDDRDAAADPTDAGVRRLPVRRGDASSFATLALILSQLRQDPAGGPAQRQALTDVADEIARVRTAERALGAQRTLDGAAVASRGALAALRRVTRESADIAIVTDRAGRVLARTLGGPRVRRVVVPFADDIDRPSLKALARACLLGPPGTVPVWEWRFSALPGGPNDMCGAVHLDGLEQEVRAEMLRAVLAVLGSTPPAGPAPAAPAHGRAGSAPGSVGTACGWLTTQNYDAAIRWAVDAVAGERSVDALRVLAVAATNTGRHDLAIRTFHQAYEASVKPTLRAHLCAMQALVIAKRKLDLVDSARWYERGLAEVARRRPDDDGDPATEEAWIYNGLALNALLEARLSGRPIGTAFDATFDLLVRAFKLVEHGTSADHVYLRYNLLGNMSAFMSIQGQHRLARDLFERAFDASLTDGLANALEWRAVLTTRRAGLYVGAGEIDAALGLYRQAVDMLLDSDRPVCAETIRRSAGILTLRMGRFGDAEAIFREGLAEALRARSRLGARVHGAGLIHALVRQDRVAGASDVLLTLGETEGLWLSDPMADPKVAACGVAPPTRLFGLSTSIPEIDLENLEPVRIAEVLSAA
jgi:tetratricopeptide (TPR) repeat protein